MPSGRPKKLRDSAKERKEIGNMSKSTGLMILVSLKILETVVFRDLALHSKLEPLPLVIALDKMRLKLILDSKIMPDRLNSSKLDPTCDLVLISQEELQVSAKEVTVDRKWKRKRCPALLERLAQLVEIDQ